MISRRIFGNPLKRVYPTQPNLHFIASQLLYRPRISFGDLAFLKYPDILIGCPGTPECKVNPNEDDKPTNDPGNGHSRRVFSEKTIFNLVWWKMCGLDLRDKIKDQQKKRYSENRKNYKNQNPNFPLKPFHQLPFGGFFEFFSPTPQSPARRRARGLSPPCSHRLRRGPGPCKNPRPGRAETFIRLRGPRARRAGRGGPGSTSPRGRSCRGPHPHKAMPTDST